MVDEDKVREELRKRNQAQFIGKRHAPGRNAYDTIQQPDAVHEEHVYLFHEDQVWEADLIGDLSPDLGHGKLPPVIHMECPFCTALEDRRAMTIDKINKGYEIEDLGPKAYVKQVSGPQGRFDLVIDRHLNVREKLRCPYCQVRFTIRGSHIERVR